MSNIHDNKIKSYTVELENKKIILYTEYKDKVLKEETTIEFSNVTAHFFENEIDCNIIFEIEQLPLEKFFVRNEKLIEKGKNYGWPIMYKTLNELLDKLQNAKQSYFVIHSSLGLSGWILAENMEISVKQIK
jgi:hypothetical protein